MGHGRTVRDDVEGLKTLKDRLRCLLCEAQHLKCQDEVTRQDVMKLGAHIDEVATPLNLDLREVQESIVENISFFVKEPIVVRTAILLVQALDVVYRLQCAEMDTTCQPVTLRNDISTCLQNINNSSTTAEHIMDDLSALQRDVDAVYRQRVLWDKEKQAALDGMRQKHREACRRAYVTKLTELEEENSALVAQLSDKVDHAVSPKTLQVPQSGSFAQALHKLHDVPVVRDVSPLSDMVNETRGYLQVLLEMGSRGEGTLQPADIPPFPQYSARTRTPLSTDRSGLNALWSARAQRRERDCHVAPYSADRKSTFHLPLRCANRQESAPRRSVASRVNAPARKRQSKQQSEEFGGWRRDDDGGGEEHEWVLESAVTDDAERGGMPVTSTNEKRAIAQSSGLPSTIQKQKSAASIPRMRTSQVNKYHLYDTRLAHMTAPALSPKMIEDNDDDSVREEEMVVTQPRKDIIAESVMDSEGAVEGRFDVEIGAIVMTPVLQ